MAIVFLVSVTMPRPAFADVFQVTSTSDNGPGSLRQAILDATAAGPSAQTIVVDPSLAGQTISLTTIGDHAAGPSAFAITSDITISGDPAAGLVVTRDAAAPAMRFFYVAPGAHLTLTNVTLASGLAVGGRGVGGSQRAGGSGGAAGLGGAIYNRGTLTVQSVAFTGNQAIGGTGGSPNDWQIGLPSGIGAGSGAGGAGLDGNGLVAPTFNNGGHGGGPNGGVGGFLTQAPQDGGYGGGGGGGGSSGFSGGSGAGQNGAGGNGGFGGGGGAGGAWHTLGYGGGPGKPGGNGGFGGGGGGAGDGTPSGAMGIGGWGAGNGSVGSGTGNFAGPAGGGGAFGGAIFSDGGVVNSTANVFQNNRAIPGAPGLAERYGSNWLTAGGGVGFGGAIATRSGTVTSAWDVFTSNAADLGADYSAVGDATDATLNLSAVTIDLADGHAIQLDSINGGHVATNPGDTTPPVITFLGPTPLVLEGGSGFPGGTAIATDPGVGDVSGFISVSGYDNRTLGTQTVTYFARDFAGHVVSATRAIIVVDTTPPRVLLPYDGFREDVYATSLFGTPIFFDGDLRAVDSVDPSPTITCTPPSGSPFKDGQTTVSCTAKDGSGNVSSPVTFTAYVYGAARQLTALRSWVTRAGLDPALTTQLLAKLDAASKSVGKLNPGPALTHLEAFMRILIKGEIAGLADPWTTYGMVTNAMQIETALGITQPDGVDSALTTLLYQQTELSDYGFAATVSDRLALASQRALVALVNGNVAAALKAMDGMVANFSSIAVVDPGWAAYFVDEVTYAETLLNFSNPDPDAWHVLDLIQFATYDATQGGFSSDLATRLTTRLRQAGRQIAGGGTGGEAIGAAIAIVQNQIRRGNITADQSQVVLNDLLTIRNLMATP